jgi:hypothetical protein
MVGKIGAQVQRVQDCETPDKNQPNGIQPAFGRIGQCPFLPKEGT